MFSTRIIALLLTVPIAAVLGYKAAVVEFHPEQHSDSNPNSTQHNLDKFVEFIGEASSDGVNIIVFPEIGLNGYGACTEDMLIEIPEVSKHIVPCDNADFSPYLQELSCAARDGGIYVVVNLAEKELCKKDDKNCSPDRGYHRYNTNVVFDDKGTVIARYRKYNLFGEEGTEITEYPELSVFETNFGVKFATFICFDMLFEVPAMQLLRQLDIKNVVFSTAWFSELPFLTAVQTQAMWSYAQDINLIASGYNLPAAGSGGSGIYLGKRGYVEAKFPETPSSLIITAEVPDDQTVHTPKYMPSANNSRKTFKEGEGLFLLQEDILMYDSALLKDVTPKGQVCSNSFCCDFAVTVKEQQNEEKYTYRAVAFDGIRTFGGYRTGGIQACGVVSCTNDTIASCGQRVDAQHIFTSIQIKGSFLGAPNVRMPSTVLKDLLPLTPAQFSFTEDCSRGVCNTTLVTNEELSGVLTFGIYSRVFARDGQPVGKIGSTSGVSISSAVDKLLLMSTTILWLYHQQ